MLGEHDYIDKRWMYEESMRMPFLVRYPGMILDRYPCRCHHQQCGFCTDDY